MSIEVESSVTELLVTLEQSSQRLQEVASVLADTLKQIKTTNDLAPVKIPEINLHATNMGGKWALERLNERGRLYQSTEELIELDKINHLIGSHTAKIAYYLISQTNTQLSEDLLQRFVSLGIVTKEKDPVTDEVTEYKVNEQTGKLEMTTISTTVASSSENSYTAPMAEAITKTPIKEAVPAFREFTITDGVRESVPELNEIDQADYLKVIIAARRGGDLWNLAFTAQWKTDLSDGGDKIRHGKTSTETPDRWKSLSKAKAGDMGANKRKEVLDEELWNRLTKNGTDFSLPYVRRVNEEGQPVREIDIYQVKRMEDLPIVQREGNVRSAAIAWLAIDQKIRLLMNQDDRQTRDKALTIVENDPIFPNTVGTLIHDSWKFENQVASPAQLAQQPELFQEYMKIPGIEKLKDKVFLYAVFEAMKTQDKKTGKNSK